MAQIPLTTLQRLHPHDIKKVVWWLVSVCVMVLIMVVIGGVTRLTGSGLSIVEWKPLMGAIPPLSHQDWLDVFGRYQTSPQYHLVNRGMSLSQFQWIFFWEYFHRLVGRMVGLVFLLPWAYFQFKGILNRRWSLRLFIGFLLGGLQGLVGWVMVASGLVDQPHVSHFRLAAHLLLAFGIMAYFWKAAWDFQTESQRIQVDQVTPINSEALLRSLNVLLLFIILQILYGAFVAGLKAGLMYNTFPDMEGQFFPLGALIYEPFWKNLIENPLLIQWIHRWLGTLILIGAAGLYWRFRGVSIRKSDFPILGLFIAIFTQFAFGVVTLLTKVNLPLAVIHQVGASLVLMYILWLRWEVKKTFKTSSEGVN